MKLLTIVLTTVLICGTMLYAIPEQYESVEEDARDFWQRLSLEGQAAYILGVGAGAFAMAVEAATLLDAPDLLYIFYDRFPERKVRDYIFVINTLYEDDTMRHVPAWLIIFRLKEIVQSYQEDYK